MKNPQSLFPYDSSHYNNPYLTNVNKNELIVGPENLPLSAEYIWNKKGKDRENLLEWIFQYYRNKGFPKFELTNQQLKQQFDKLKKLDPDSILNDNLIKNSNSTGLDILKHFIGDKFYKASNGKIKSVFDAFTEDNTFRKVLKNRMGWNISFEDNTPRPFVFGITDKMIVQGIRSSSQGSLISSFKPAIAKFLYNKYVPKNGKIFDYCAGWGARLLAALSLNMEYYGTDPLTYKELNNMMLFFNGKGEIYPNPSEDETLYQNIPEVDFIFSSPPYFNYEIYSHDNTQSYNQYPNYDTWLSKYWNNTVLNCLSIMKDKALFSICIIDKIGKINIANDMLNICYSNSLKLKEKYIVKTSQSHLSNKRITGKKEKITENIYVLEK
jgi:hypothetical protein